MSDASPPRPSMLQRLWKGAPSHDLLSPRQAYGALAILLLVQMINVADRELLHILLTPIKTDLELSDTQIGLLTGAAFSLFYAFAGIPMARLADRVKRRDLLAACLTIWSGATMLCAPAGNYWHLLAARVGVAGGEAAAGPAAQSMLADLFPREKRTRAIGLFFAGASAGHFGGLFLGGLIATYLGWRMAFVLFGLFGVALALTIWLIVPEPRRGAFEVASTTAPVSPPPLWTTLRLLFGMRSFALLIVGATVMNIANLARMTWVPTFLIRVHGMSLAEVGLWVGVVSSLGAASGNIVSGMFTDRLLARGGHWFALVPAIALIIAAPLILVFSFSAGSTAALAALLPVAFLMGVAFTPSSAMCLALAPAHSRATAVAITTFAYTLIGGSVGPFMIGALSDGLASRFGDDSLRYAFLAMPVTLVTAAIAYFACSIFVSRDLARREGTAR